MFITPTLKGKAGRGESTSDVQFEDDGTVDTLAQETNRAYTTGLKMQCPL